MSRCAAQECRNRTLAEEYGSKMGINYRKTVLVQLTTHITNVDFPAARVRFLHSWADLLWAVVKKEFCLKKRMRARGF